MTQYHFLDDSGDPGLSGSKGSSSHFALAMVQLAERAPLSVLASVRRRLHFPPTVEFKYFKAKPKHKTAFFEAIQAVPFRVRSVVVEKSNLPQWLVGLRGNDFTIELIVRLVMRTSELDGTGILVIDEAMPELRRKLRVRLSREYTGLRRVRPFKKIVGGDSVCEDGLQVADMLAGALRHFVLGDEREYYQTFVDKVVDLWQPTAQDK